MKVNAPRSDLAARRKRSNDPQVEAGVQGTAAEEPTLEQLWPVAVEAAREKKGEHIKVLDLRGLTSFTDYFVVCSGSNQRQIQAIADEIQMRLKALGFLPLGMEGYDHAEWVLIDYGSFIVHIFAPQSREYYDLERLWRQAKAIDLDQPQAAVSG
jgi:ribosome-associated protein